MKQRFRIAAHIWVIGLVAGMTAVAQQPAPYRLTLQDAIQKALQANLSVLAAGTRVEGGDAAPGVVARGCATGGVF